MCKKRNQRETEEKRTANQIAVNKNKKLRIHSQNSKREMNFGKTDRLHESALDWLDFNFNLVQLETFNIKSINNSQRKSQTLAKKRNILQFFVQLIWCYKFIYVSFILFNCRSGVGKLPTNGQHY